MFVTNDSGVLTTGTVTVTITKPDGTTTSPVVTTPSTGRYLASYKPTLVGRHVLNWTVASIGGVSGEDDAFEDMVEVSDTLAGVVSLTDARNFLNIDNSDNDDELQRFIDVVSTAVETYTNRVFRRRTVIAEIHDTAGEIVLSKVPVISVTSVAENGVTMTATQYSVLPGSGVLRRLSGTYTESVWLSGADNIAVTYVAGYADVPDDVTHAALLLVKHMWTTQRTTSLVSRRGGEDAGSAAAIWTWPMTVRQLLDPYCLPAFA